METLFDVAPAAVNGVQAPRNAIGCATEHLVTARLLELGVKVAVPVVDDDGVDLVVDYRTTVQVKASALHNVRPGLRAEYLYWSFKSPTGWRADVYVFRGVADGVSRWWVVPHEVLVLGNAKSSVIVNPNGTGRWAQWLAPFEDNWAVLGG